MRDSGCPGLEPSSKTLGLGVEQGIIWKPDSRYPRLLSVSRIPLVYFLMLLSRSSLIRLAALRTLPTKSLAPWR